MSATLTPGENGPIQVSGDFTVTDADGTAYPLEAGKDVYLCRCGQSGNKPFCDGSHKRVGFVADERVPSASE